ncbi:ABC-type nitrate/sulfonate/bicarbonate transport system ATPase subunit [Cytobacillus eiseniae]|uniref:ABC-type nitrate/sulfonate/bicarbonate transport system ATPase subunit n=1 Tax=Cytobacillus eiseniae TaxID=762947 RepID=A0ABS4RF45_9BACI|nr:ABC transporter ATP-binding protein [Cytobacillus eiseniae]MBP2241510.1 ABC-type nitrate/sulfonate/bicarbonate transport system ATPase subunit [Cytobacillus eiseniae]
MDTLIEFNNVTKKYKNTTVLDKVSFQLRKQEVVALLGPSGCGKTTILNIAAGLTELTTGEAFVHTNQVGYIFQEPRLLPWKTVLENLLFVIGKGEESQKMAFDALAKVGLENVHDSYPSQLSGGMRQRISIARALAFHPQLILMDEPFSALDILIKKEIQNDLLSIIDDNRLGVMYVTHDAEEAARIADRILLLHDKPCRVKKEVTVQITRQERSDRFIKQLTCELCNCLLGGELDE